MALTIFFMGAATLCIEAATLFLYVGVARRFSADELLSLSVDNMLSEHRTTTPSLLLFAAITSLFVLILATILFAFHYVQRK